MGEWIPLMDYAMKKAVSLSTLRRHIKAGKVQYKVENGRYLLFVPEPHAYQAGDAATSDPGTARLQSRLQKAQEEIAELKTLIAFYEESLDARSLNSING